MMSPSAGDGSNLIAMTRHTPHSEDVKRAWSYSAGYSLIEVLVAAGILVMGIAAAAVLALTMVSQQEGAAKAVRALNYQEQACRLYQFGVAPSVITNILPPESSVTSLTFTTNSLTVANLGTMEFAECSAVVSIGSRFSTSGTSRTLSTAVVRPSIR